ncbi:MAG: DUF6765 family protein [Terasakiella sp.]|uniref:DUF6765 family protein n=1 Tax=unclassified Terasakiella TaxID=2614952 RepID=UPI003B00CF25
MQKDMHYYGVYVLARCAGLNQAAAHTIATASQFVDDAGTNESVTFLDASMLDVEATAHHILHVKNLDPHDQRRIWVPFHFYPGGEGASFTEKLLCRKDSLLARKMVKTNVEKAKTVAFGDALIGVTAHVYADTFAHYDFSGVSSRLNRVAGELKTYELNPETKAYVEDKKKRFFKENGEHGGLLANIKGFFGGNLSGALGHGGAATYPDRPYLRWSLEWEDAKGRVEMRDNSQTYMEACEKLYDLFVKYGHGSTDHMTPRPFEEVRDAIQAVIETQGKCADREKAWCDLLASGQITGVTEEIPVYAGEKWLIEFMKLRALEDGSLATQKPVVQFFQAAAFHRQTSLRDILPRYGLIVG